jgi:hypothetical protein
MGPCVTLTVRCSLPVYPDKQTCAGSVSMSQKCHQQATSATIAGMSGHQKVAQCYYSGNPARRSPCAYLATSSSRRNGT